MLAAKVSPQCYLQILSEAIKYQSHNPLFDTKIDMLTYHEALNLIVSKRPKLNDIFVAQSPANALRRQDETFNNYDMNKDKLYFESFDIDEAAVLNVRVHYEDTQTFVNGVPVSDFSEKQLKMVARAGLVLAVPVKKGEFKDYFANLIGTYNHLLVPALNKLSGCLLIPYEQSTWVAPRQLGSVTKEFAYTNNPLHPCFYHFIEPASVVGFAVEGDVNRTMAFVSQPKLLNATVHTIAETFVTQELKPISSYDSLQDIGLALQLLKLRFGLPISQENLDNIHDFDQQIQDYRRENPYAEEMNVNISH